MGISLTVREIIDINKDLKENLNFKKDDLSIIEDKKYIILEKQKELTSWCESNRLGTQKTQIFKGDFFIEGYKDFKIKLYSNAIKKPIKVRWTEFEDGFKIFNEYQEKEEFKISIDNKYCDLYIFTNKHSAKFFTKILKDEKLMSLNEIYFDFSKINNLNNLKEAWGYWEEGEENIRRQAFFGKNLDKTIDDFKKVTTLYIDYIYKIKNDQEEIIQLCLSNEGRMSTQSKYINQKEIVKLFNEIYKIIRK